MKHCHAEIFNENTPQENHWGNLVMFHWVAPKQCSALLHSCLVCGHIISLEAGNLMCMTSDEAVKIKASKIGLCSTVYNRKAGFPPGVGCFYVCVIQYWLNLAFNFVLLYFILFLNDFNIPKMGEDRSSIVRKDENTNLRSHKIWSFIKHNQDSESHS